MVGRNAHQLFHCPQINPVTSTINTHPHIPQSHPTSLSSRSSPDQHLPFMHPPRSSLTSSRDPASPDMMSTRPTGIRVVSPQCLPPLRSTYSSSSQSKLVSTRDTRPYRRQENLTLVPDVDNGPWPTRTTTTVPQFPQQQTPRTSQPRNHSLAPDPACRERRIRWKAYQEVTDRNHYLRVTTPF